MVQQRYTRSRLREDDEERRYRGPQAQRRDPETGQFMSKDDVEQGYRGRGRSRRYQEDADYEGRERRGFAALDPERRREIARMGAEARWGRYEGEEEYENRGRGREWRGFGSMPPEERREIASMGGQVAHQRGTAHEWTPEEAREAGRRGGMARGRREEDDED